MLKSVRLFFFFNASFFNPTSEVHFAKESHTENIITRDENEEKRRLSMSAFYVTSHLPRFPILH